MFTIVHMIAVNKPGDLKIFCNIFSNLFFLLLARFFSQFADHNSSDFISIQKMNKRIYFFSIQYLRIN
jgi:hypothetical protein